MGFAFQQLEGEGQEWQPAFLTSIDHRPSVTIETPTFPPAAQRRDADEPGADPDEDGLDAITPLSEVRSPTFFNRMSVCGVMVMPARVRCCGRPSPAHKETVLQWPEKERRGI